MKKILAMMVSAVVMMGVMTGCGNKTSDSTENNGSTSGANSTVLSGSIKLSGSTSVEKLAKAFGEAFTEKNSQVTVDVQGGGSGAASKDVSSGVSDIGNLSRDLKDDEKTMGFKETKIAIDGIAVAVNPKNGVADLTVEQIGKIFSGVITNWKEVGGTDAPIVVIGREAGSGTRDGFEELVGIKGNAKYSEELNETGLVKTKVASTDGAIGYMSEGYVDNTVKALKVGGVEVNKDTIKDKSYPIQRNFVMITKGDAPELVNKFMEFVLSAEGQAIVEKLHFVSIK